MRNVKSRILFIPQWNQRKIKRFWDLETVGIGVQNQEEIDLTTHEKITQKKVEQSLTYNGERYEVRGCTNTKDQTFLTIDKWQRGG